MKNQKGITLTSLIIYIVLIFIILIIITRVSVYFTTNMSEISKDSANLVALDNFNLYFLQEVKKKDNSISEISGDSKKITFSSGTIFNFENNTIYFENSENKKIVLSEEIDNCTFSNRQENDKTIIIVEITISNETKQYEYIMEYENKYKTYKTEGDYFYNTIINNTVNNTITNEIINNTI